MYAKISQKGQVTIPKAVRKILKIDKEGGVLFLVEDDVVKLKGVPGEKADRLAGSLNKYTKKYVSLDKIRQKIKGKIADEAAKEGLSD
ncbi:MAG: AbrB/MazE/SpoVT family DNA-binding domain-containing protein [Desulfobacterales bacterium]